MQQDRSRKVVRISILERGEILGFQECNKRISQELPPRKFTATCVQNNSTVLFLSYQHFYERVMAEVNTERDLKFENILKNFFAKARQHQA